MAKIMTINSGSSSLKFKLYEMPEERVICSGNCERIGLADGIFTIRFDGKKEQTFPVFPNHAVAARTVLEALLTKGIIKNFDDIKAMGHRIVQGGKYFSSSALFSEDTEKKIESLIPLAPLHNQAHLTCYRAFKAVLPNCPNVAVFDTAFHQSMAPEDYVFAIPHELSEKYDIRRYGAHGTSHKYLSEEGLKYLPDIEHPRIISCHIGSGASITAIKDGKCVATSMGLTPLGGIMMCTRTGDMDPSVFNYVASVTGQSAEQVYQMFNKKSGFLGMCGFSDSRDVLAGADKGDEKCILANTLFVRRIADFIGQYYVRLGGCDLIIFSAGIGENEPRTRREVAEQIGEALGVKIDHQLNNSIHGKEALISLPDSKIKVAVIPTDEEVMIARDAYHICIKETK
ncbi:MAG TPA: acetate kinase [Bacilli bacterium]|nr:acetate kinase [Bacilli bacterium]HPS18887.1 acetate kinase [Bacilli bacterium]